MRKLIAAAFCFFGGLTGAHAQQAFEPNGNYTSLTATAATSASTLLPSGSQVAFMNIGTDTVSCVFSATTAVATTSKFIVQAGQTLSVTVGSNTHTACIDQTAATSNVVILVGGRGLLMSGGGGGSGGGGSVTQGTSPWVDNVTQWASGVLGAMANYGTSPGAVLVPGVNAFITGAANFATASAAIPSTLNAIGISDGGTSCSGGACLISPTALVTGLAGAPAAQTVTTQPPWIPTTAIATGTTGAVTATLAIVANKTNYICGFDVSAIGGTAAVSPITVTGLLGGTFTYQGVISAVAGVNFGRQFSQCIPASGVGVAIAVVTTADGTASAVDVQAWGYYQ